MKALVWRDPDGAIGCFVDTLHGLSRLEERLFTFRDFPELHAEIVDVEIVVMDKADVHPAPIPDLEHC